MKKILSAIVLSSTVIACANATPVNSNDSFTDKQKDEIGKIASQYIYEHPEVLMKAAQKLQEKQMQAQTKIMVMAAVKKSDTLLNTSTTPVVGDKNAKVAVIEFFDYECVFCHREAPEIAELMKNNKDVKFVFQEFPIFSSRFTGSKLGAEAGFAIYNLYGSDKYMQFHNSLFLGKNANKDEGNLKDEDIYNAIKSIKGVDLDKVKAYMKETSPNLISNSMNLGASLGINGTPGIIIMPTKGADASNTKIIPGYVRYNVLQKTLDQVKASIK